MTINRLMHPVKLVTYKDTIDSYGQRRKEISNTRYIEASITMLEEVENNDPSYLGVTAIGLTKDFNIGTNQAIIDNGVTYRIKYTNGRGRLNKLYLDQQ